MKHRTSTPLQPTTEPIPQFRLRGFRTKSGTVYDFNEDHSQIRRIDLYGNPQLRHDGEWITLMQKPRIEVGRPAMLFLEPLGEGNTTVRTTTTVEEVYW